MGITIDSICDWKDHIESLCKKLSPICFALRKLKYEVDFSVLKVFYFGHFHSLMMYGVEAWGSSADLIRVFRIQKRALRVMMGSSAGATCRNLFRELNIMTLPCVYIWRLLLYAKRNFDAWPKLNKNNYHTRNLYQLEVPRHRLTFFEGSPQYTAIKLMNKLSNQFKLLTYDRFKKETKQLLIQNSYYSVAEFLSDTAM